MNRITKTWTSTRSATCRTCERSWDGANALAVAAIHARTHSHVVALSVVQSGLYRPAPHLNSHRPAPTFVRPVR